MNHDDDYSHLHYTKQEILTLITIFGKYIAGILAAAAALLLAAAALGVDKWPPQDAHGLLPRPAEHSSSLWQERADASHVLRSGFQTVAGLQRTAGTPKTTYDDNEKITLVFAASSAGALAHCDVSGAYKNKLGSEVRGRLTTIFRANQEENMPIVAQIAQVEANRGFATGERMILVPDPRDGGVMDGGDRVPVADEDACKAVEADVRKLMEPGGLLDVDNAESRGA